MRPLKQRAKKPKTGQNEKAQSLATTQEVQTKASDEIEVDLVEALTITSSVVELLINRHYSNVEIVHSLVVRKLCIRRVERWLRTSVLFPISLHKLASLIVDGIDII
jgi:hypothetical protein